MGWGGSWSGNRRFRGTIDLAIDLAASTRGNVDLYHYIDRKNSYSRNCVALMLAWIGGSRERKASLFAWPPCNAEWARYFSVWGQLVLLSGEGVPAFPPLYLCRGNHIIGVCATGRVVCPRRVLVLELVVGWVFGNFGYVFGVLLLTERNLPRPKAVPHPYFACVRCSASFPRCRWDFCVPRVGLRKVGEKTVPKTVPRPDTHMTKKVFKTPSFYSN